VVFCSVLCFGWRLLLGGCGVGWGVGRFFFLVVGLVDCGFGE